MPNKKSREPSPLEATSATRYAQATPSAEQTPDLSVIRDSLATRTTSALQQNRDLLQICKQQALELTRLEEALSRADWLAGHDTLTGLANRRLLVERFEQTAALSKRHEQKLALVFLDLDNFKHANDALGHAAGDEILCQVAKRLTSCIRGADTACRIGGDEFIVLLTEIDDKHHAWAALRKIRAVLSPPYRIDRKPVDIAFSDGMAIFPNDGRRFGTLLRHSDLLMFRQKARNRR